MNFSLWAPGAGRAELRLGGRVHPLLPGTGGVWRAELPPPGPEAGYRFALEGSEAWPDPCSLWQPDGIHGDSRWIDLAALRRHPAPPFRPRPLAEAVIYELHVGTFTPEGTYAAVHGKLRHLAELGVTHVELMPLATFPGRRGWGYDGVYLYAPHPAYGRPEDLAALVDACHAHGLAVLLDVVYNHLGPDGNYAPKFGPYLTDRYKTDWGQAMNFDGPGSDEVRRFVIDNARMWLRDYGFDGLRLDAVHAIDCLGAVHVLEDLAAAVAALGQELGRDFVLIAESDLN
ncbi:MAG TPA: alpha-amylase family glycosyl hydrolase, partial [Opitutaceae bacterium]|nr:alpha-amylase family glycosyl hydrolase [Opitutaceae bacterium]